MEINYDKVVNIISTIKDSYKPLNLNLIIEKIVKNYQTIDFSAIINKVVANYHPIIDVIIKKIKDSYILDFENNDLSTIKDLNDKISNGISTPVLFICGDGSHEIRYTKYLTYYLDYKNNHGLNKKLFLSLFKDTIKKNGVNFSDEDEYKIYNEYQLATFIEKDNIIENHIDIAIISQKFNIFIEHKIFSGESKNSRSEMGQLDRYKKAINETFPKQKNFMFYLTPKGLIPENVSDWKGFSHRELIENSISLFDTNISEKAKSNLNSFLMDLSIGPYFKFDKIQKIKELCEKILKSKIITHYTELNSKLNDNRLLLTLLNY